MERNDGKVSRGQHVRYHGVCDVCVVYAAVARGYGYGYCQYSDDGKVTQLTAIAKFHKGAVDILIDVTGHVSVVRPAPAGLSSH